MNLVTQFRANVRHAITVIGPCLADHLLFVISHRKTTVRTCHISTSDKAHNLELIDSQSEKLIRKPLGDGDEIMILETGGNFRVI